MENKLELRLYGLVPYNISPIQQGIQFGHAAVRYSRLIEKLYEKHPDSQQVTDMKNKYIDWADNWETFIILNGGTTNKELGNDLQPIGTLNQHMETLKRNGIPIGSMYEPDLGNQLTAVVFVVDERVFNKKDYPDFREYVETKLNDKEFESIVENYGKYFTFNDLSHSTDIQLLETSKEWRDMVGGDKNVFLKEFLEGFRLA